MKKIIIIAIIVVILIIIFGLGILSFRMQPVSTPAPTPSPEETVKTGLVVLSPSANQEISSPLKVIGYVNGDGWTGFEGQTGTVELVSVDGNVLATAVLKATTEWTEPPVKFEAPMEFIASASTGKLIFHNENPSGNEDQNKTYELPVRIAKSSAAETMKVKAYFGNSKLDPQASCNKVFAVEREIPKTLSAGQAAIGELLKGPTEEEKSNGYFTSINSGVKLQKLTIENGTAYADFDEKLEQGAGGSCKVTEIRTEITQTLLQFPTIKKVVISINNRTEDILQP